jgi:hypothetical protein
MISKNITIIMILVCFLTKSNMRNISSKGIKKANLVFAFVWGGG